ncbi:MAG: hypothetical protein V4684_12325 [Pseudomonadota bacterium]
MDDRSINASFQRHTTLPPAQRGIATQAAAANKYAQEELRNGNNQRTQDHLRMLFEKNAVPPVRAKLLADRWRGAVEVKFASEQALGRRDLSAQEIATHRDHVAVADQAIAHVQKLAQQNFRSTASLLAEAANLPPLQGEGT